MYTIVAVVMLLLVLSIILLIYKNYKRSRRHIITLTSLNEDIRDKKAALVEALAKLEKESKSKDQILKVVAHDLRNPLHGIAGLAGIVASEEGLTKHQTHIMSLIQSSCKDALQLINEILEVAGLSEVKKLSRQPTDINAMVSQTVELLQTKALEKKQQIVLDVSTQSEHVFINREKITRVISNLINNSIKFSPLHEEIYVKTEQNKDGVIISVKDKGIGIPANLAETVFDTFTPAKRPGTSGEKSFGLGLSICRQIVEAHDGKIWFESEPGAGTTFHVQLN
jgi:two-component system sensor histidine kinase VicK